jgi:hypothetical protein
VQIADDTVLDDGLHDGFIKAQQQVAPNFRRCDA